MERMILHVDQNCFFASVEMKNHPELRTVPMAVGGDREMRHGIILAKNKLAADFGIKTAETIWQAKKKCPGLVIVPGHYDQYEYYSGKAYEIYCQYTDRVEPFGLDECWLDITGTGDKIDMQQAADEIRMRIRGELGLTCSVGGSFNKVFAKLGSDYRKPDATTIITKDTYRAIVWPLPVRDLLFAGQATERRLARINIHTIGQLANAPFDFIVSYLGKNGETLWRYANGLDDSPVSRCSDSREIKSIGNSTTQTRDLMNDADVHMTACGLADQVAASLRRRGLVAGAVQISIRDCNLISIDRQARLAEPTDLADEIKRTAMDLFRRNYSWEHPVRSIGIRAIRLEPAGNGRQISLFGSEKIAEKRNIASVIDNIREKYGVSSVMTGIELASKGELRPKGEGLRGTGRLSRDKNVHSEDDTCQENRI
jgi:DNA polymerase-4